MPHTRAPADPLVSRLHPDINEAGPVVGAGLGAFTRDDPRYWSGMPKDHNAEGLFVGGPQEAKPAWTAEVIPGAAPRSTESGHAVRERQAYERREKVRRQLRRAGVPVIDAPHTETRRKSRTVARIERLIQGTRGQFTGPNRQRKTA